MVLAVNQRNNSTETPHLTSILQGIYPLGHPPTRVCSESEELGQSLGPENSVASSPIAHKLITIEDSRLYAVFQLLTPTPCLNPHTRSTSQINVASEQSIAFSLYGNPLSTSIGKHCR